MNTQDYEAMIRYRLGLEYWERVEKSEGFDVEGITPPDGINGLKEFNCCASVPCCGLVTLYATLGLHRYNYLQGKNLQLSYVKKYNKEITNCVASYYITLVAMDPTSGCHQNFQTQIDEKCYGELDLSSYIARPQGIEEPILNCDHGRVDYFYIGRSLWPLDTAFNDRNRFYVVKDSELRDNDWIRLYLKLAVATTDRSTDDHDLSDLKIVNVVIETKEYVEPPNERLNAKNAIVYILYKRSNLVDCKAIVRRTFDERWGCFSLFGEILSSEFIPKKDKNQSPPLLCTEMSLERSEDISNYRMELKYCKQFAKSEGFEIQGLPPPPYGIYGLKEFKCDSVPCCGLVILYARLGIHRYNLLQGTKLQLIHVKKYNKDMSCCASYYITLVAKDPDSGLHQTFQTQVNEECLGEFELTSYIARPQRTKDPILCCDLGPVDDFYIGSLPEWPRKKAFKDRKRFYVVKKSQLRDNDWISLYLELAIATTDRSTNNHDLSDLKILEVAIETKEDVDSPSERLNKRNAIVYIRYHGKARAGNPVDCIAIVRRTFGERKGKAYLSLQGRIQSAESIPKMGVLMEENKAKREDDMISKLPDILISEILLYLPTKEAVRTSVLSNRWRSLWLLIPGLDLDSCEFLDYNAFTSFINLDFSREDKACLHKLKLSIHKDENENHNQFCVTRWIDFVARRKLKHLDVECFVKLKCLQVIPLRCLEVMPVSLFVCQTLLYLRLRRVLFSTSFEESSVSLPHLKTLRLEQNVYSNETSLESLISYCPVLEDLTIVRRVDDNVKYLRVRSQTLISLRIKLYLSRSKDDKQVDIPGVKGYGKGGFLIDAPRLKYLNIEDERTSIKTITNSGSLNKVILLGDFLLQGCSDQFHTFFTSFSGVRELNLSHGPSLFFMQMVPIPQFCNLSHFEASLPCFYLDTLLMFLPSCPNLRSLILNLIDGWARMRLSSVHLCLLSSLEFVEIECKIRRFNPQYTGSASDEIFHARRKFRRLK